MKVREMILTSPRDENGDFFLVYAEFRDLTSINFCPTEQEIELLRGRLI